MSSSVLLADRLAAALRSHFDQGHLGKREILIDLGAFNLFSRHYPVKFFLPVKDIHRSIEEPMSQDLFANIAIECHLKTTPGELKVIFAQILNGLLHRMSFQFSLPASDADLLGHMQVESIESEESLKAQMISLRVSFHSGNGRWKSIIHDLPLNLIYSAVDLKRIWIDAKNPGHVNFTEFLGSAGPG